MSTTASSSSSSSSMPDLRAYESMLVYSMAPLAANERASLCAARSFRAHETARAEALSLLISTAPGCAYSTLVDVGAGMRVGAQIKDTSRAVLFDIGPRRISGGSGGGAALSEAFGGLFLEIPPLEALARARAAAAEASSQEVLAEHKLAGISKDIVSTLDALTALRAMAGK